MKPVARSVKRLKWRILGILWLSYALMYFGRVNMAVTLPLIEKKFGLTTADLGLVSAAFFWVYAFGQFANGILGERLSARKFVCVGLVGTGLVNVLFGFSRSVPMMVLFWACNGVFQSMGWGPILKTASAWTTVDERSSVSSFLNTSFVLGSLLSWCVLGRLLDVHGDWRMGFWVPGVVLIVHVPVWAAIVRDGPTQAGVASDPFPKRCTMKKFLSETAAFLHQPPFLFLAATTAVLGVIKNGILLWTPTLLMQYFDQSLRSATVYALLIPLFSMLGIFLAAWLNRHLCGDHERTAMLLFAIGALLAAGFQLTIVQNSIVLCSILIGLCATITYGIGVITLSFIPLKFSSIGKTSALAGFLDFSSYIGSGVTVYITGLLVRAWGWKALFFSWIALFVVGALSMLPNLSGSSCPVDRSSTKM